MAIIRIVGVLLIVIGALGIKSRKDEVCPWYAKKAVIILTLLFGIIFTFGSTFSLELTGPGGNSKKWTIQETKATESETVRSESMPAGTLTEPSSAETITEASQEANPVAETTANQANANTHVLKISDHELSIKDLPGLTCTEYENLLVFHDDSYNKEVEYLDSYIDVGDIDRVTEWGKIFRDAFTDRTVSDITPITINGRDCYYISAPMQNGQNSSVMVYVLQNIGLEQYLEIEISMYDFDGDLLHLIEEYAVDL